MPKVQTQAVDTRKELAEAVGVGERTMGKAMKIEDEAPQNVRDAVERGELSIHQGYNLTKELQDIPQEELEAAAKETVERSPANRRAGSAESTKRRALPGHSVPRLSIPRFLILPWTMCRYGWSNPASSMTSLITR